MTARDAEYHVTAVRNGGVYGHTTNHCDEAGCSGDERYLGPLTDWPGVERGRVYGRDADGSVYEVSLPCEVPW